MAYDPTGNGNLRPPWKKGQTGNPKGREKGGGSVVDALKRKMKEELSGRYLADAVAQSLIKQALKGDVRAIKELMDRVDGPVKQMLEANVQQIFKAIDRDSADKV